jgi:hypothetical protein
MSIYKRKTKLALLIIAGLIISPFAEAAFRTAKTGKGKFNGSSVSTITSTCLTNGFPSDTAGANLCQEVTAGTYDTDCVNWGLDQSPVLSISSCSGLTHTQYTSFKTARGQATLAITSGGNGFTSYTEQKSYFDIYLTNTKAIYANQLGYNATSDHNTTYEDAASAVSNLQTQCSNSDTSPLTTCSSSISNCACIPKSEYEDIASGAVAIAAALDAADNTPHTLTKTLIDDIVDLDTSSIDLTDSNVIDYLAAQFAPLDSTSTTQPSQLTSYVVGATATNVALWKIGKMISDSTNHPSSGLTENLIDDAVGNSFSTSDTLALDSTKTISTLRTALSSSGLGSSPTASAVQDWVGTHVGFASAASFTAYLANSDSSNFTLSNWNDCYSSSHSTTGGAGSCNLTNANWSSIASAIAAVSDTSQDITAADAANILSTASVTAHSFFDSSDAVMMGYLNQCISGQSDAVDAVVNCVSSGSGGSGGITETVLKQNVTAFKLGKIAATNSGTYTTSTVTQSDMVNIGLGSNESGIIGQNYCGTSGNSSCLSVISSALSSASLTADSSATAVQNWINSTMRSHFQNTVAANQSAPANPSSSGDACAADNNTNTVTMPLIGGCNHSSWTCTFASKSPSSLTLDLADGNVKLVVSDGGPVTGVSYTIRKTLNYTGSSYYKDFSYSMDIPASSNASANVQLTTHSGAGHLAITPWNHCLAKGVGWELAESSEVSQALKNAAPNTKVYAKANTTAQTVPICGSSFGNNNIVTNWATWRNHSSTSYRVKYRDSNDNLINGACRSNSGGASNSFWCRNAAVYSCN